MADPSKNDPAAAALLSAAESDYGADYRSHYFTQYRDFVASADRVSSRRHTANTFFLGINTALVGGSGYFRFDDVLLVVILALFGVVISLTWIGIINSHKTLNSAKYKVIQDMERNLPLAPYLAEEIAYESATEQHVPFSEWERWVPRVYIVIHLAVGGIHIWRLQ